MQMPQFITNFRRNLWRDQVIRTGRKMDDVQRARWGLNDDPTVAGPDPAVADWADELDAELDRLRERHRALLTKIKETA